MSLSNAAERGGDEKHVADLMKCNVQSKNDYRQQRQALRQAAHAGRAHLCAAADRDLEGACSGAPERRFGGWQLPERHIPGGTCISSQ